MARAWAGLAALSGRRHILGPNIVGPCGAAAAGVCILSRCRGDGELMAMLGPGAAFCGGSGSRQLVLSVPGV